MAPGSELRTHWFDGLSPRGVSVTLRVQGDQLLLTSHDGAIEKSYPLRALRWPERRSHGQRQTELPDGGLIQHADAAEWDAWHQANGFAESRVVGWTQSWRGTVSALFATLAVLAVAWVWGVPWLSLAVAELVPASLEAKIGEQSLSQIEGLFLKPSQLPAAQQAAVRQRFSALVQRAYPEGDAPPWRLSFHSSELLGPNAFALPGGAMVITDDLVKLLHDQPDAISGVLAHELGHVKHRHGLDLMVRASLVSALVGVVLGDASGFLAAVPATLATRSYSRDAEREADLQAASMLHSSGISPGAMAIFFERIQQAEQGSEKGKGAQSAPDLPIAIATHPDHSERIRFFRDWVAE